MTMTELPVSKRPDDPFNNPVFRAAKDVGILSWTIVPEKWSVISDEIRVNEIAEDFLAYTIEMSELGKISATVKDINHTYNIYKEDNIYTPIYRIQGLLKFYVDILLHY